MGGDFTNLYGTDGHVPCAPASPIVFSGRARGSYSGLTSAEHSHYISPRPRYAATALYILHLVCVIVQRAFQKSRDNSMLVCAAIQCVAAALSEPGAGMNEFDRMPYKLTCIALLAMALYAAGARADDPDAPMFSFSGFGTLG